MVRGAFTSSGGDSVQPKSRSKSPVRASLSMDESDLKQFSQTKDGDTDGNSSD